ncbi:EF-hand domain-containing protein [Nostoc sp. UIC 10630]|uniref:EF-hand domain-containing protein n=1 Tax=Nostoc sp. UIC 10630 TaxID=2100146 RepID=UPI0013D09020|nr:histidine kinase [Nostoc sp. UIC 10630]
MIDEQEIEKLWQAFKVLDVDGNGAISTDELGEVMRSLGQNPTETGLRDLIKEIDVDLSGTIDFDEFKTLMIAKVGDRESRLKLAFSAFDVDNSGQITAVELRTVMSQFGLTDVELKEMLQEVDHDGDGSIDFEEFCQLVPEESETKTGYKDSPISLESSLKTVATNNTPVANTTQPTLQEATSNTTPELAQLREQLVQHPNSPNQKKSGTSRLQMQIGLFRLIQGAAYRSFRESFSANHETHLRVKNLPYRITDFVEFVKQAIALYKGLGVVEEACYPVLDAVVESIADEYARLQERVKDWKTVAKTPEMLAEEKKILEARSKFANVKEKFAAGVEFAITIKKKSLSLGDIVEGVLAINELNRLRGIEMNEEMAPPPPKSEGNPRDYLWKWNRVILSQATEEVDGAMMPIAYWYEDFMPKLLAAFSVSTAADIQSNTIPDEAALDEWYNLTKKSGEFNRYGADVAENFLNCTAKEKLILKQAWRLTHHYLNGVQKRRERLEFGRESGALSQYVSFIDVYLNRTEVKDSQMRVSFPYYIGPAVWRFFHTTAEIACTKTDVQQKNLIAIFKDFFQLFATMYPCPYCRHHLNMYVVQNKEVDMYPVEYLVLGRDPNLRDFEVSLEAKLSTVVDGSSLRLFFWKLHNTVSSSIARSEEWYHKDEKAFYTTRFWPSLDSELARANALRYTSIETARIYNIYGMLKPLARLTGVKTELPKLLQKGDENSLKEACIVAQNHIADLEEAVIRGEFLQETYYFEPALVDKAPLFTPEEEEFARTGMFTEIA